MNKIDYKKGLKMFFNPSAKEPEIIDIPSMNFLMIDGAGNPNTSKEYKDSVEALFSVSYSIKFAVKKSELAIDYGVLPLEGLWWTDDMNQFSIDDKDSWKWTSMIMQPEFITNELVMKAIDEVKKKKDLLAISKVRFEKFKEGKCAQIMHVGPYALEGPTVKKLHDFIVSNGFKFDGVRQKHHEIYLNDPRKCSPEKMKTIIRQPVI